MKRTELKRGQPLERRTPLKPSGKKALKRTTAREWGHARAKVEREGVCRNCGAETTGLEAAHTIGREYDEPRHEEKAILWVNPDSIIPLCGMFVNNCHGKYDAHQLDILHLLTLDEQLDAVKRAGGLELARKRLCPSQYRDEVPKERETLSESDPT